MKRLLRWAARLYPAAWRRRYGDEFDELLDQSGAGWREMVDVFWGGLAMRMGSFSMWALAAAIPVICAIIGIAAAVAATPRKYVSTAALNLTGPSLSDSAVRRAFLKLGLPPEIRKDIAVIAIPDAGRSSFSGLTVDLAAGDPSRAQRVLTELVQGLMTEDPALELLDLPSLPRTKTRVGLPHTAAGLGSFGFGAGLLIAGCVVWSRRRAAA
jgi:hypothetical protein